MSITAAILSIGTGASPTIASNWLSAINAAMDEREINTPQRIAAFLANVGVESNGLSALVENLLYSANALCRTWPNRYAVDQHATPLIPNALALSIAGQPEKIANNVYANRMGNGDEASGDGWKYRGEGPIQITGKSGIAACGAALGFDLLTDPTQLQQPVVGSRSAAWFFESNGCNELADNENFAGIVRKINGQPPCNANSGPLRTTRYNSCLTAILAGQ